jgi:hypothetical protein
VLLEPRQVAAVGDERVLAQPALDAQVVEVFARQAV